MTLFPQSKSLAGLVLALGLGATAAPAFDLNAMSDAERLAFGAEVRSYLMENPEVLMEAIGVLEKRQETAKADIDRTLVSELSDEIFNDGRSWSGGNPDGDVTLVEFIDYRCGYCRRAHDDVAELISGDGNIRFVIKEFPILGEDSLASSRFAIATRLVAGPDAYKRANDALIKLPGAVNSAALQRLARNLDLDVDKIMAKMDSDAVSEEIQANRALAQKLEINGTPTFVIQDEVVRGYIPLDSMQEMVEIIRTR